MPKLFVAVELADDARAELMRVQPMPIAGMRLSAKDQMHLTLHHIGPAEVDRVAEDLNSVKAAAFEITIAGVGHFPPATDAVTLWAGVQASSGLLHHHAAVGSALAEVGFIPEARRYTPHITLARCGPEFPSPVIDDFLARHRDFALPRVSVETIGIYSSTFVDDVPIYSCERSFRLKSEQHGL